MNEHSIYFATNRNHEGEDRWRPSGYGIYPSSDRNQNLRFGKVVVNYDQYKVTKELNAKCGFGKGNGDELAEYFLDQSGQMSIQAFEETLEDNLPDPAQSADAYGSTPFFAELRSAMEAKSDVLVFVHGFNVSWWESVSSALSLEFMLNRSGGKPVKVVLFSWPSDGSMVPYRSYFSDREDAKVSASAVARGFLKLRDYLMGRGPGGDPSAPPNCDSSVHLLCHSMGNFVLQKALKYMLHNPNGRWLPKLFDQAFLCAADVDDNVLEKGESMYRLRDMARRITVYHNEGDVALWISDTTKGNPDRLGQRGPRKADKLDDNVYVVDCGPIVKGWIEHSYYLCGHVNDDIRECIDHVLPDKFSRRVVGQRSPNVARLR